MVFDFIYFLMYEMKSEELFPYWHTHSKTNNHKTLTVLCFISDKLWFHFDDVQMFFLTPSFHIWMI